MQAIRMPVSRLYMTRENQVGWTISNDAQFDNELPDYAEYLGIGPVCVVKARRINEDHYIVADFGWSDLDRVSARS